MRKKLFVVGLMAFCWTSIWAQESYLNRPDLLNKVDSCLRHTYNFSFIKARHFQMELARITPDHPAPYFLEALIVYWENYPLTPEKKASEKFVELMDRVVALSEEYSESERTHLEGVFFDLFGRAFKAMFWADNGKPGKVLPDLSTLYRNTKEGFEMKDQFSEFYFSTGLYNYYIEAYPEAHPGYKALVAFMQDGDKALGLQQLKYAIDHAVFLKVESIVFMSIIQLKYERDLNAAAMYAEMLFKQFPHNLFYQGHLVTILLHQKRFQRTREVLKVMEKQRDPYSEMIRVMANSFMAEMESKNDLKAEKGYESVLEMADRIGPYADLFMAIGYMGLSRIFEERGVSSESGSYARKAAKYTSYRFILEE